MNRFLIGKILRPRGLKGELKVEILTNRPDTFSSAKTLFIDNMEYKIERGSIQNGYAFIVLSDVDTIEKAEKFRNKEIFVNAADIKLNENEVLSADLVGFIVLNQSGEKIGMVKSVENYGGGDFFEIAVTASPQNELRKGLRHSLGFFQIPNEDEFIIETNMTNRTLTVTDNALQSETIF